MSKIENENLYTDSRVLINEFVKQGRTKVFTDEIEAYRFAEDKNSYYYDVYNDKGKSVGFAVPVTVTNTIKTIS